MREPSILGILGIHIPDGFPPYRGLSIESSLPACASGFLVWETSRICLALRLQMDLLAITRRNAILYVGFLDKAQRSSCRSSTCSEKLNAEGEKDRAACVLSTRPKSGRLGAKLRQFPVTKIELKIDGEGSNGLNRAFGISYCQREPGRGHIDFFPAIHTITQPERFPPASLWALWSRQTLPTGLLAGS